MVAHQIERPARWCAGESAPELVAAWGLKGVLFCHPPFNGTPRPVAMPVLACLPVAGGLPTWRATRSATTCPWAGWVLACPTVGRWRAYLACHQIGHHLPVAMPVLTCHQIKRTTCPWA